MKSFIDYAFNEEYRKVEKLGDKLAKINKIIDWDAFKRSFVQKSEIFSNTHSIRECAFRMSYPIINDMYNNKSKSGGHQILMKL